MVVTNLVIRKGAKGEGTNVLEIYFSTEIPMKMKKELMGNKMVPLKKFKKESFVINTDEILWREGAFRFFLFQWGLTPSFGEELKKLEGGNTDQSILVDIMKDIYV